jgi:hypothetical protein
MTIDNDKLSIAVDTVIWKRPALPDRCWFAGKDWALSRDETH